MGEKGSRKLLTRKEAAAYITENYFTISAKTLAAYSHHAGPTYRILGGMAHYKKDDIDQWVENPGPDKSAPMGALSKR